MDANVGQPKKGILACKPKRKNQWKTQLPTNVPYELDQRLPKATYICLKRHTFKLRGETL